MISDLIIQKHDILVLISLGDNRHRSSHLVVISDEVNFPFRNSLIGSNYSL